MWMKASGLGFEEVRPDDVVLVSWDGEVLAGNGRPATPSTPSTPRS